MSKITDVTKFKFELLDECFCRRNTKYSTQELFDYMMPRLETAYGAGTNYSKRSLNRDILKMKDLEDAPIACERKGDNVWYYWYTDPNWSYKNPVFQNQLSKLSEAIVILDELQGLPHSRELAELRLRLQHHKNKIQDVHNQILIFKNLPAGIGEANVEPLYEGITGARAVEIVYERYNSNEPKTWKVHPYSIIVDERHWYLYCYNDRKKDHSLFSLDRIKEVRGTDLEYRFNDVPAEIYLKDIMGMTRLADEEVQDIELAVSPKIASYLVSRPLHHSQQQCGPDEDGMLHIRLQLRINPELIAKILSYGAEVKVLKSERLKKRIKDEVDRLSQIYAEARPQLAVDSSQNVESSFNVAESKKQKADGKGKVIELTRVRRSASS
jgi:predicted DNA-binding transcriptional regulator YafY